MDKFIEFNKIARLSRMMTITEKIDGTNSQVYITESSDEDTEYCLFKKDGLSLYAGSKSRLLIPSKEKDNFGFAKWVQSNAEELITLGIGRHFGEWWGKGIQRKYEQTENYWSLFNTSKWLDNFDNTKPLCPSCCKVVPVLYRGMFDTNEINATLVFLLSNGSMAAPGFLKPEGVVIYHEASGIYFKKTFENDEGKWLENK